MITRGKKNRQQQTRIIFYDLETTGFNPYHCQIIEIGACDNFGNIFSVLMKPDNPLPEKIIEVTKITDDLLNKDGVSQKDGLEKFNNYINNDLFQNMTYLVAHNNHAFDSQFLKFQSLKYGVDIYKTNFTNVDTLKIAQYCMPNMRSHSMGTLSKYFNIVNKDAHRAYSDAITLQKIFKKLQNIFVTKYSMSSIEDINNTINNPFVNDITKKKCRNIDTNKSNLHSFLMKVHDEIKTLTENKVNFKHIVNKNSCQLVCLIRGIKYSPYENKGFYITINLTSQWPSVPPIIQFVTKIYHPNIDYNSGYLIDPIFDSNNHNSGVTVLQIINKLESMLSLSYLVSNFSDRSNKYLKN